MAGKRKPTSDLNHDNWDREEEAEERGNFPVAPAEELKTRVFKKAVRKVAPAEPGAPKQSAFSGFAGFGSATAATGPSPFSFLSNIPGSSAASSSGGANTNAAPTFSFGTANKPVSSAASTSIDANAKPTFSFGTPNKPVSNAASAGGSATSTATFSFGTPTKSTATPKATETDDASANYCASIVSLNQKVSEWIKTNIDRNPCCDLRNVFEEYTTYWAEIEKEEAENPENDSSPSKSRKEQEKSSTFGNFKFTPTSNAPVGSAGFSFASSKPATSEASKTNGFSFGAKTDEKQSDKPAASSGFSFGAPKTTPASSDGFSFGAAKSDYKSSVPASSANFSFGAPKSDVATNSGFSFGKAYDTSQEKKPGFNFQPGTSKMFGIAAQPAPAADTATASNENDDDDEDQPPKVEFKPVVEEDAAYSKKCKVYVKKDENYTDRGLGTLFLKPVKGTEKTQLIVRADTSLGNVIINMLLVAGIPVKRMGKNNVLIVGMPTPEEKPTSILIRVKTGEEADELLQTIESYQSK